MEGKNDIKSLKDLLLTIVEVWERDESAEVRHVGQQTREELETAGLNTNISQQYFLPTLTPTNQDTHTEEIFKQIVKVNGRLPWKIPLQHMGGDSADLVCRLGSGGKMSFAMILGTTDLDAQLVSEKMYVGLGWLAPGTEYPAHAHQAWELYHVVKGRAAWGPSPDQLRVRNPGDILVHQSGEPHMMVVPEDQYLLTVYAWTGDINGR